MMAVADGVRLTVARKISARISVFRKDFSTGPFRTGIDLDLDSIFAVGIINFLENLASLLPFPLGDNVGGIGNFYKTPYIN